MFTFGFDVIETFVTSSSATTLTVCDKVQKQLKRQDKQVKKQQAVLNDIRADLQALRQSTPISLAQSLGYAITDPTSWTQIVDTKTKTDCAVCPVSDIGSPTEIDFLPTPKPKDFGILQAGNPPKVNQMPHGILDKSEAVPASYPLTSSSSSGGAAVEIQIN